VVKSKHDMAGNIMNFVKTILAEIWQIWLHFAEAGKRFEKIHYAASEYDLSMDRTAANISSSQ
jgi:hypothetical protein